MSASLTESPERLRLGIDMDGVIADFNAGWIDRYNSEFGTSLRADQVMGWDGLHAIAGFESMARFWSWARGGGRSIFRDLPPVPGAIEALEVLAAEHRVVIITSRFDWAIGDTFAWLAEHGVICREVHFIADKQDVACDVYLDDAPHQLEALTLTRPAATVCRAVRPYNRPVKGATDVTSWEAFHGVVERVAAGIARSPGSSTG